MIQLFLRPTDVWLFRNGKPFTAGGDHMAESYYPPHPSVIQGAFRSKRLSIRGTDLFDPDAIANEVGLPNDYKNLRIQGPFVAQESEGGIVERFFPQPADATSVDTKKHTIKPASSPEHFSDYGSSSSGLPMGLGLKDNPQKGESGLWVDHKSLLHYLKGETVTGIPSSEFFDFDNRVGISINQKTASSKEGFLYSARFVSLKKDCGLVVGIEDDFDWSQPDVLALGGESRPAFYKECRLKTEWERPNEPLPRQFKLYFSTPTYFSNGWFPDNWGDFFDRAPTLVAAAIGRYQQLGGIDLSKKHGSFHRPSYRFVPAGSVYYFECKGETKLKIREHNDAVVDSTRENKELWKIGYGQIIIEEW